MQACDSRASPPWPHLAQPGLLCRAGAGRRWQRPPPCFGSRSGPAAQRGEDQDPGRAECAARWLESDEEADKGQHPKTVHRKKQASRASRAPTFSTVMFSPCTRDTSCELSRLQRGWAAPAQATRRFETKTKRKCRLVTRCSTAGLARQTDSRQTARHTASRQAGSTPTTARGPQQRTLTAHPTVPPSCLCWRK